MSASNFAQKTLQDYEVLEVMGNGAFGTCYKVRDKETGQFYAWKGMNYDDLDDAKCESLISEICMLRQLQHPNIVQYYHHLINREAKSIYIVMECCAGGDLAQLIKRARSKRQRFEERFVWRVLFQLCHALQVCHLKIPAGTILHRDIKPANIFLDAQGNAKLGDFGLARMLRRDQTFAASFVGTPHYMSPELVKGRGYDRKSDVWAVGCLVYEMCALRPPFRGQAFDQLSENITQGQFNSIPAVYSGDLHQLIAFMLAVDHEQRPGIEVITRHPLLVRNINDLGTEFPRLIDLEADCPVPGKLFDDAAETETSMTFFTTQHSFNEDYGQRRQSVTGIFTPDLRSELFYSTKRRVLATHSRKLQRSDPALYESILKERDPILQTQDIFDSVLQARLAAIRAQESLLEQRAAVLEEAELRVQSMERELQQKLQQTVSVVAQCKCQSMSFVPPVPPRKPRHDDTYCSIEPNDTSPTVAKMDLALLPAPKSLRNSTRNIPAMRKVTFHDVENLAPGVSVSSKGSSEDSGDSNASSTRRKSILSLFGLGRGATKANTNKLVKEPKLQPARVPLASKAQPQQLPQPQPLEVKPQPAAQLANLWTKEQKRAAFDLLAVMNAAEKEATTGHKRQQLRQSVRERSVTMQRNRQRRSLVISKEQHLVAAREQMLI